MVCSQGFINSKDYENKRLYQFGKIIKQIETAICNRFLDLQIELDRSLPDRANIKNPYQKRSVF